jgi:hypothetical protein
VVDTITWLPRMSSIIDITPQECLSRFSKPIERKKPTQVSSETIRGTTGNIAAGFANTEPYNGDRRGAGVLGTFVGWLSVLNVLVEYKLRCSPRVSWRDRVPGRERRGGDVEAPQFWRPFLFSLLA